MAEEKNKVLKPVSKRAKWPWIVLIVVTILIMGLRLLLKSEWALNYVKYQIEHQGSQQINGEITVRYLVGDLFRELTIRDISVKDDLGVVVFHIDSVYADYSLLSLLRRELLFNEISVFQPYVNAIQDSEENWNIMDLLPQADLDETAEQEPSSFVINIKMLRIHEGTIDIESPSLPDTVVSVHNLEIDSYIRLGKGDIQAGLNQLEMRVTEGRFAQDIAFSAGGSYDDGLLTLDKLTLNTGATMLEVYSRYQEQTGEVDIDAVLEPLSWRDVVSYSEEPYFVQDVRLRLGVSGSLSAFVLNLGISARGIDNFTVEAGGGMDPDFIITSINIHGDGLDLPVITGNPDYPRIGSVRFDSDGYVPVNDMNNAKMAGALKAEELYYSIYSLSVFETDFNIDRGNLAVNMGVYLGGENVMSQITAQNIFDEPTWNVRAQSTRFDPTIWLQDEELTGRLNFVLDASGPGFEPADENWSVQLLISRSELMGQKIENFKLDAKINAIHADMSMVFSPRNNEITAEISVNNWQESIPDYTFAATTSGFDMAEIKGFEEFPTSINFSANGTGSGIDLETLSLAGNVVIEESLINGAQLDRFQAMVYLRNQILNLNETFLRSTFAEGNLTVRKNISDPDDRANRIDFDLDLLELQPLAPLIGSSQLAASGQVRGTLRSATGAPELQMTSSLRDILIDSLSIGSVELKTTITGFEESVFEIDSRVNDLLLGSYLLDDIWLRSAGTFSDGIIEGNYRIDIEMDDHMDIATQARYHMANDSIRVETTYLRLANEDKQYNLSTSFLTEINAGLVKTTPLVLLGSSGVELRFQFEQYKDLAFRGSLKASDVELEMMQRLVMDEYIVKGKMTGNIDFDIDLEDEAYNMQSELVLRGIDYAGFIVELIEFNGSIQENRLKASMNATRKNEEFMTFEVNLPFMPGDPLLFDDDFFMQPVEGRFYLGKLNLLNEQEFLRAIGFENTTGIIEASGTLEGLAGNPDLSGDFHLVEGRLSGVSVDSVKFDWNYNHSLEHISMSSLVVASGQKAADIRGTFPLLIDWRTFSMIEPEDKTGMDISIQTNDFDLAALNQFLDQSVTRQLRGRLGADLLIEGEMEAPQITGTASLRQGGIYLVDNNVNLRAIEAQIDFRNDVIMVRNFAMQSLGSFTANGEIRLDGFIPQSVNMRLNARNFQVMDTRDAQAIITFNTILEGSVELPGITGSLTIDRGFVYLDNFGERTVEEVRLEEEQGTSFGDIDFWNNLSMEMKISTERNFWLRNRSRPEIQLQLNGELDLVKSKDQEVEVFGRMGVTDGYVTQLGKRFTFDQGDVIFSGDPTNPQLQIRTLYALRQPSDIKIWYVIGGTAEKPTFAYESDPEMELQDIVSYTVFGRPFHSLMAWEQNVAGRSDAAVADAALDILLDRVEQLASERLGIDVFQIENTRTAGNSGTTIKAGKFISEKFFVALLQELGSNISSRVMVEYQLRRNLDLIVTGSDSYQTGVDILWKYDY